MQKDVRVGAAYLHEKNDRNWEEKEFWNDICMTETGVHLTLMSKISEKIF